MIKGREWYVSERKVCLEAKAVIVTTISRRRSMEMGEQ